MQFLPAERVAACVRCDQNGGVDVVRVAQTVGGEQQNAFGGEQRHSFRNGSNFRPPRPQAVTRTAAPDQQGAEDDDSRGPEPRSPMWHESASQDGSARRSSEREKWNQ